MYFMPKNCVTFKAYKRENNMCTSVSFPSPFHENERSQRNPSPAKDLAIFCLRSYIKEGQNDLDADKLWYVHYWEKIQVTTSIKSLYLVRVQIHP